VSRRGRDTSAPPARRAPVQGAVASPGERERAVEIGAHDGEGVAAGGERPMARMAVAVGDAATDRDERRLDARQQLAASRSPAPVVPRLPELQRRRRPRREPYSLKIRASSPSMTPRTSAKAWPSLALQIR